MSGLAWSWLAAPYLACTAIILAVAVAAAVIRGDRVLRIGVIGAAVTAIPWAACQALAACTDDPIVAVRLLRIGNGPVALVGPNLMLVLLAVSGQLERHRWIARIAGVVGFFFFVACWATTWTVPGVQRIPSGMFYLEPGPLTGLHVSQLVIWLGVGLLIVRRSSPAAERRRTMRLLLGVLVFGAIGSIDTLLLYRVWGIYPIAWLPSSIAAAIALYLVLRTDLLRPQGFDRGVAIELAGLALTIGVVALLAIVAPGTPAAGLAAIASVTWAVVTAATWALARSRRVKVTGERALEAFVARVAVLDDDVKIAERAVTLWKKSIGIEVRATWSMESGALAEIGGTRRWTLEPDVVVWLVEHGEALAFSDLATMRLGALRGRIEALFLAGRGESVPPSPDARHASLIVPLIDRGELVGLVEANYDAALREEERGLVAESARAVGRALTFVGLARAAARERDTAREVEVAGALRLQASASRDAELGRWAVAVEYRTAPKTTGAGWTATELADGRLAVLVTEAQAHGVAAALATAALTGAFAGATAGSGAPVTLEDLITALQASSDGVIRGGEPVAAFLAILDARGQTIEWACAGHPGGFLVGPVAALDASPLGSTTGRRPKAIALAGGERPAGASLSEATRGTTALEADMVLVIASTALRGPDDAKWELALREAAPAAGRLATVLVELAARSGEPIEDLLAVVVRAR
jgi:GAF domain-containing protein